jgi:hypothetical protein
MKYLASSIFASQLRVEQRTNDGMAEEKYLEGVAAGQKAQTDVLGADRVMMLNVVDKILPPLKFSRLSCRFACRAPWSLVAAVSTSIASLRS